MENPRSSRLLHPILQSRQLVGIGLGTKPRLPTHFTHLALAQVNSGSLLKPGRQSFTGKDGLSLALAGHAEVCLVTLVAISTQYLSDGKPVTSECHRRTFQGLLMAPPGQQIPSSNPELILVLRNLQHLGSHGQPASVIFIGGHPGTRPFSFRN